MNTPTRPAARARQLAALWIARNVSQGSLDLDAHPAEVADVRRELLELARLLDAEALRIECEPPGRRNGR